MIKILIEAKQYLEDYRTLLHTLAEKYPELAEAKPLVKMVDSLLPKLQEEIDNNSKHSAVMKRWSNGTAEASKNYQPGEPGRPS